MRPNESEPRRGLDAKWRCRESQEGDETRTIRKRNRSSLSAARLRVIAIHLPCCSTTMSPYHHFVSEFARLAQEGKAYPLGNFASLPRPAVPPDAPKVLIFSPHPDDEVIVGGLALRLMREANWNVLNVAVTQGSRRERQAERWQELKHCCDCIGFGLVQAAPSGLEKVNPNARDQEPAHWTQSVQVIARLLAQHAPRAVLFPHDLDWNSTH